MERPTDHPDYGARTLQIDPPCSGRDVWDLQIKLIGWGSGPDNDGIGGVFEPMKVTGTFDLRTRHAVMRFQKAVGLKVTGTVDSATFHALDREAALYPVLIHLTKCPCVTKANDKPTLCRCCGPNPHPDTGACKGFGNGRFAGKFLLDGKSIADGTPTGTSISGEKLDLYDMQEYKGIDKAVAWAVRALMRRAGVTRIGIASGYRCWEDNYHHFDDIRWHHRKLTFHFGKAIEFFQDVDGKCAEKGADPTKAPCPDCDAVRHVALTKCGFQLRWQEPDRVSVAEGTKTAHQPANPFAVHVNTVRRLGRKDDDYVTTFFDSVQPLYSGKTGFSFPVNLGDGVDPRQAPSEAFFGNIEKGPGGTYPLGSSRMPHGGVHLHVDAGAEVRAIADGEVIGFRAGEAEDAKPYGSRNFVLMRHEFNKKKYYSLYYHLAAEADPTKVPRWLQLVNLLSKKHVEAIAPCPYFIVKNVPDSTGALKPRLKTREQAGLAPGEMAEITAAAVTAKSLGDDLAPADFKLASLAHPASTWVATSLDGKDLAKVVDPDASLHAKLNSHAPVSLATPIRVFGGEVIGKVGKPATNDKAKALGTFVHVEVFSDQNMMPGDGWQEIDIADANSVCDRRALVQKLLDKNLLAPPPDKVLLEEDVQAKQEDIFQELLRSVILKMPSAWSMDWKAALPNSDCLKFMDNAATLGGAFNDYRWWNDLKANLPAPTVFHFHPIGAILAMIEG
jgi:hypothetical protein